MLPYGEKMSVIIIILDICIYAFALGCAIGYIIYYFSPTVKTWEMGCWKLITFLYEIIYENIKGKSLPDKIVDTSLILNHKECLDLVKRFENQPYDLPCLTQYEIANSIIWIDVATFDLDSKYKNLGFEEISQICKHVVLNYFMETRQRKVYVSVKTATSSRLYFAIALSKEAENFLIQNENTIENESKNVSTSDRIEEEIDIFDEAGDTDEIRL